MFAQLLFAALATSPPHLGLKELCVPSRAAALAQDKASAYEEFIHEEGAAREQLRQQWSRFPANARSVCVCPSGISESHVELLTCLQMESGRDFGTLSQ